MPPNVGGVGVAVAKAFASFLAMLPLSLWTPQALKAVEIRTREAMIRTRRRVSISRSGTREYTPSWPKANSTRR